MNITATLGGLQLKEFTIPFIERPVENAADIVTLDGTIYTDFVNQRSEWELNWHKLDETDYNDLKAIYDSMFSSSTYPTFVLPYYSINTPVRMYINDKDVRKDGCYMMGVQVRLVKETGV